VELLELQEAGEKLEAEDRPEAEELRGEL